MFVHLTELWRTQEEEVWWEKQKICFDMLNIKICYLSKWKFQVDNWKANFWPPSELMAGMSHPWSNQSRLFDHKPCQLKKKWWLTLNIDIYNHSKAYIIIKIVRLTIKVKLTIFSIILIFIINNKIHFSLIKVDFILAKAILLKIIEKLNIFITESFNIYRMLI